MRPLVGEHIETLKPYVPGKPIETLRRERGITGEIIKLASNENPLGPSPKAMTAARAVLEEAHIYPDGAAYALRARLAKELDVDFERIVVGNGSNELLEILVRALTRPGDHAVLSQTSFIAYRVVLQCQNIPWTAVPMAPGLVHDLKAMGEAVKPETRLVFIANPNNPTGTYNGATEVEALLDKLAALPDPPLVVIDEAYVEYAEAEDYQSSLGLHARYPRLITLRTFSKCYGLAALRVGYLVTSQEIAGYLRRTRAPFNVNRVGQAAATAALDDQSFVDHAVALNATERARVGAALKEMGVEVIPSQTNFLLCRCGRPGAEIYDKLLDLGVIVRPMDGYGLHAYVRISLGTVKQNDRLLEALAQVLAP